jgi:type I restriction enzyme, S subunit
MSVPKLRFTDDDGIDFPEWADKFLGEIASFSKGKGISKADIEENGVTPCIRYGELYTEYGETIHDVKSRTNIDVKNLVLSEANDVIIPASGETQIDIATASCVQVSGVALGGDLNIIKSQENGVFLTYYLNSQKKLDIAKLAQGNSVVHLYSSQLKSLNLKLPAKSEQTKIANFLSAVDEKITQLTQKCDLLAQYKKGVMQQVFSQELRFKDDNGRDFPKWEDDLLANYSETIQSGKSKARSADGDFVLYGSTGAIGFTDKPEYEGKAILIARVGANAGYIYEVDGEYCVSDNTLILTMKKSNNYSFFFNLLTQANLNKLVFGSGQPLITGGQLKQLSVTVPSFDEQTKIANFLTAIDDKINNAQTQLAAVKQYKQGLLQQLFV